MCTCNIDLQTLPISINMINGQGNFFGSRGKIKGLLKKYLVNPVCQPSLNIICQFGRLSRGGGGGGVICCN